MEITSADLQEALRIKAYFPYRKIWVAKKENKTQVLAKPTAHLANNLARNGWKVWEIK